jgi:hypothetical protein
MPDRYLRIVLTVIAVELAWIGVKDVFTTSVVAQAQPAPTRVVISGVDLPARTQFLPVAVTGSVRGVDSPRWATPDQLRVESGDRPLRVEMPNPINARIVEPIHVDTSRPLDVKSVAAEGATRPGL